MSYCLFHQTALSLLFLPPFIEGSLRGLDTDIPWDSIRFSPKEKISQQIKCHLLRLPKFIQPESYDIEISPNLETLLVQGAAKLNFKVKSESDFIVFHSKNMSITGQKINNGAGIRQMSDGKKIVQGPNAYL